MGKGVTKKLNASCLILAGGLGTRLTPDKPLLEIDGKPIIQRVTNVVTTLFDEVIIVTNTPDRYEFLHLPCIPDERQGCGPLMGIYSGLKKIFHDIAFVCAADMPFLNEDIIRALFFRRDDFDIVVPGTTKGKEFLHAFYSKRCLTSMKENLDAGRFKIGLLTRRCHTLYLDGAWVSGIGGENRIEQAFVNINTKEDYQYWMDAVKGKADGACPPASVSADENQEPGVLQSIESRVLQAIEYTLTRQETNYHHQQEAGEKYASLWAHSSRVGRIAYHIAQSEGWDPEPALLAGLLHDLGKFARGAYHEDDTAEEQDAVKIAERILSGTSHQKWFSTIRQAILSTYLEGDATNNVGRAVYDADSLDKLGNLGVVQFFAKKALRRQFLNDDVITRAAIELTYAYHAPDTLKTKTGRALAKKRSRRTRRFYEELLEEWAELGLGEFRIVEEDIAGIVCVLVVPTSCACGGRLALESDILDSLKCRSVIVRYPCSSCNEACEFSFCLPNVKGLPAKNH